MLDEALTTFKKPGAAGLKSDESLNALGLINTFPESGDEQSIGLIVSVVVYVFTIGKSILKETVRVHETPASLYVISIE